jgi:WD40 repeat protein
MSFLTDTTLELSLLASTSRENGQIVLWDLNAKKIHCIMKSTHGGRPVNTLNFISGEPVLLTASDEDNSIKMWLLEKGQSQPRLLRERCGHADAPTRIRFYGGLDDPVAHGAKNLISCSKDGNLRDINLLNEFMSMNFSKKKQLKGIHDGTSSVGPVKHFDFS